MFVQVEETSLRANLNDAAIRKDSAKSSIRTFLLDLSLKKVHLTEVTTRSVVVSPPYQVAANELYPQAVVKATEEERRARQVAAVCHMHT